MSTFLIVWLGQVVSTIGSRMTSFALTIWAWELTGEATALTLTVFFTQLPKLLLTPFAGLIVDRGNRKQLIMLGDTVAGLSTTVLLVLWLQGHLQIWHLYLAGMVNGTFEQLQELSYAASITSLVPQQFYSRATGLGYFIGYGSKIFAPMLAGAFYPLMGLGGIMAIDLVSFGIAIATVYSIQIPQPAAPVPPQSSAPWPWQTLWRETTAGCRYLLHHPSLLALLLTTSLFWLIHDLGGALFSPMILARTGNDTAILGSVSAAAGAGGMVGAAIMSAWSGPKPRIHGILLGMVGAGLCKVIFGLGQMPWIWIPIQFCSSLNFPLVGSSEQAIWLAKVNPQQQGRVFAVNYLSLDLTTTLSYLIAGPLADRLLEPAMKPGGSLAPWLGGIFGVGPGAGMALLYVLSALGLVLLGLGSYTWKTLRQVEARVPDHEAVRD